MYSNFLLLVENNQRSQNFAYYIAYLLNADKKHQNKNLGLQFDNTFAEVDTVEYNSQFGFRVK